MKYFNNDENLFHSNIFYIGKEVDKDENLRFSTYM